ncbi:MAG: hypothetical protein IPK97_01930 [Ahniella sp.]|nr:hypothetical protein [Ahniella sp.]
MARVDCSGVRDFGQVRVQWRCPAPGRVCTVDVFWLGQLIMSVPMGSFDPVQSFSVTTENPPLESVAGEFRYGPSEGHLRMTWLQSPEGSWLDVPLCPAGPIPPPPPDPEPDRPVQPVLDTQVDSTSHDLFPYVFLKQWPNIDAGVRADNFIDYGSATTPVANSLYANLVAIDREAPDARSLSISQGLLFIADDPPYTGQRVTRADPLVGLMGELGPLWRGLLARVPCTVDVLVGWFCIQLHCTWAELVANVEAPEFDEQFERAWENLFAQMLVPGYDRHTTELMLRTIIVASLLDALVASLATDDSALPLEESDPLQPLDPPLPDPALWPPARLTERAYATVVLPDEVYPLPPESALIERLVELKPAGGTIRPYAVGALQVVRKCLLRYEPGELANIENVMPGERKVRIQAERQFDREVDEHRQDRRDDARTETEGLAQELAAETNELLYQNTTIDYSVNYGPPQEGVATGYWTFGPSAASGGSETADTPVASESQTNSRTEWARSITQRAARRLEQRISRIRTQERSHQRDWSERHTFDRRHADTPLRGIYRWLNAVYQCWVASLGERLVLELHLPRPAQSYIAAELDLAGIGLTEPQLPAAMGLTNFTQVSTDPKSPMFYAALAAQYGLEQLETPPPETLTVACTVTPEATLLSGTLVLPEGYAAASAQVVLSTTRENVSVAGQVGQVTCTVTNAAPAQKLVMTGQVSSLPWAFAMAPATDSSPDDLTLSIEVRLDWDIAARARWQATFYAGLMAAYRRQLAEYLKAADQTTGRQQPNHLSTRQTIQRELKRGGLRAFVELALQRTGESGRVGRFLPALQDWLERALEWGEMSSSFVVSLEDQAPTMHRLVRGGDAQMTAFLEAASARVLLPVRPGFERSIVLFLASGVIWNGEELLTPAMDVPLAPEATSTSIDLLEDIKRSPERCACERAHPSVGPAWLVLAPTTLTVLQEGNELPTFPRRVIP